MHHPSLPIHCLSRPDWYLPLLSIMWHPSNHLLCMHSIWSIYHVTLFKLISLLSSPHLFRWDVHHKPSLTRHQSIRDIRVLRHTQLRIRDTATEVRACLTCVGGTWMTNGSECLHIYLPICVSMYTSAYLFACLSVCLTDWLTVCLPACLSVCLSVCLTVCLTVYLSVYVCVCLFVYLCCMIWHIISWYDITDSDMTYFT